MISADDTQQTPEPFDIVYRDEWLVAINKPAGLLTHRTHQATDRRTCLDLLRDQIGQRVWAPHRLDRKTSGLLLFALSPEIASSTGQQFQAREVGKVYLAVVRGWLEGEGELDHPVKDPDTGERYPAVTRYRGVAKVELPIAVKPHPTARYSLARLEPKTGRRHQLRRHMVHLSHPIIGDTNYGHGLHNRVFREHLDCHRMLLHASELRLTHPASGKPLEIHAPVETGFAEILRRFGWENWVR